MEGDKRFSKIAKDARFKVISKKDRKVRIDSRFKTMFTDKKFKTKYYVDKRGRPVMNSSKEDLKRFYEVDEDTEGNDVQEKVDADDSSVSQKDKTDDQTSTKANGKETLGVKHDIEESDEDSDSDGEIDFSDIRGGAGASSSDEEDVEVDEEEDQVIAHDWGELDIDAPRKEDAVTSRLAACNLDWDRINADDLFVLFNSFGGSIKSVKIFLSEFGKERLADEDLNGPRELKDDADDEDGDPNNEEGSEFHLEKLRQYQLNRLRYYYAVVECDSKETANKIYDECDGMEYELSATRLDVRFIPDETEFEGEPKEAATQAPLLENYQPTTFCSTALQQSSVRSTWDEPDLKRIAVTMKKFNKDEILDMDFKAYLASSSDEEDGTSKRISTAVAHNEVENYEKETEDDKVDKYRALLKEIETQEHKDDDDQHMEISWELGLSEKTEKIVQNKIEQEQEKSRTPWEKYVNNKSKKKKERHITGKSDKQGELGNEEEETENINQEDPSVNFDDPFFNDDDAVEDNKKEKKKKKKKARTEPENEDDARDKNELELLLMEDKEEKQHFNLKSIIANEKKTKKKRKHDKKKPDETTEDNFEINVKDSRFDALFTSHNFAPDPSDPLFKKTKAMEKILEEKQRRRTEGSKKLEQNSDKTTSQKKQIDPSLSALVKTVKSRTEQFQNRKKSKLS